MRAFLVALISWAFAISFVNTALAQNCTASTEYSSPGTETIGTVADITEYLAPCETFFGSLDIYLDQIGSLNLRNLKNVTGSIQIIYFHTSTNNTNSTYLSLGQLQHVGGDLLIYSGPITELDISNLTSVGGSLRLNGGPYAPLNTLSLPRLLSVGKDITVFGFSEMVVIDMPLLTLAGELNLQSLPALIKLNCNAGLYITNPYKYGDEGGAENSAVYISDTSLTFLENIFISNFTDVTITNNPTLNSITLSGAESNTSLENSNVPFLYPRATITNNGPNLTLAFPLLTAYLGYLTIGIVASLNISSLVSVSGELDIVGNMPTFSAPNLQNINTLTLGCNLYSSSAGCDFNGSSGLSNVSLPSVQNISSLNIYGVLAPWSASSLSMPKIKSIKSLFFDLSGAKFCQYWAHQRCRGIITDDFCCGSLCHTIPVLHSAVRCDNEYPATGLTYPKRLAVGLSVGVGVPVLVLFLWWIRKTCKKPQRQVVARQPGIVLIELPDEDRGQLLKYQVHKTTVELPVYGTRTSNEVDANNRDSVATRSAVMTDGAAEPNQERSEIPV